jgi:hypothetical protein
MNAQDVGSVPTHEWERLKRLKNRKIEVSNGTDYRGKVKVELRNKQFLSPR